MMGRGGATAPAPEFTGITDMFDGGGAGASGGPFQGHDGLTNTIASISNALTGRDGQQPMQAAPHPQTEPQPQPPFMTSQAAPQPMPQPSYTPPPQASQQQAANHILNPIPEPIPVTSEVLPPQDADMQRLLAEWRALGLGK